jgi:hypothetical protein
MRPELRSCLAVPSRATCLQTGMVHYYRQSEVYGTASAFVNLSINLCLLWWQQSAVKWGASSATMLCLLLALTPPCCACWLLTHGSKMNDAAAAAGTRAARIAQHTYCSTSANRAAFSVACSSVQGEHTLCTLGWVHAHPQPIHTSASRSSSCTLTCQERII